jgi:hypothetical protein
MMVKKSVIYLLLGFVFFPLSCEGTGTEPREENFERETGEPVDGIRIAWDYSSMQRIAPQGERAPGWVGYPRVRRLSNGDLLTVYETGGNVEIKRSSDNGGSWSSPSVLFEKHVASAGADDVVVNKANGELIELANGDLIAACNYRPAADGVTPFAIGVKRSFDKGATWTEPNVVFQGGVSFHNGCWEPSFLQLPSGVVQIYFANEASYTNSDEQEISMLSSADNGENWSNNTTTVCFREGFRDGMPVPVISGDEILLSIEDNVDGQFQPWVVRTSLSDPWATPVSGSSTNREAAHQDELPVSVYAGAPYLFKLPSGETVLSYQTTMWRSANWELSTMEVAVGDKEGRNFSRLSRPFNVPLNREAKWNSISLWDENTVVAASTTSFRSENCEVWTILGHVIPELTADNRTINPDGVSEPAEWSGDYPIFLGHTGMINLKADISKNDECLFFAAKIKSSGIAGSVENTEPVGVRIFIDSEDYRLTAPDIGLYSVFVSGDDKIEVKEGKKGKWIEAENKSGVAAGVNQTENGSFTEVAIPLKLIDYETGKDIRVNMQLIYVDETGKEVIENIVNAEENASNTWCRVRLP